MQIVSFEKLNIEKIFRSSERLELLVLICWRDVKKTSEM